MVGRPARRKSQRHWHRAGLPVEANEVFVVLPKRTDARLKAAGASYYEWTTDCLPPGRAVAPDEVLVRLVTSFATIPEDIERFISVARPA